MPDRQKWQQFTDRFSIAVWNLAKIFHFVGRVSGRVAEELGYEDDYPFGNRPLDRTPEEVNAVHLGEYSILKHVHEECAPDVCMIQQGPCPFYTEQERTDTMGYWFQIDLD